MVNAGYGESCTSVLISTTGSNLSPAFYLIAIALLALAGGLALPETSRISLHDVPSDEKRAGISATA